MGQYSSPTSEKLEISAKGNQPILLMVFLPAMDFKIFVLHRIFKGNSRQEQFILRKTHTTVHFTQINGEDRGTLPKLVQALRPK